MASIKSKNTTPELVVRGALWSMRKRYRVHDRTVFGTPDISSKKNKVAVFIDGCFWHGCNSCYTEPKTNSIFWKNKILINKKRRTEVKMRLKNDNWKIFEFWEHEVMLDPAKTARKISRFLR